MRTPKATFYARPNKAFFLSITGAFFLVLFSCGSPNQKKNDFKTLPFALKSACLLNVPFKGATNLNIQSLLNYDPDRLLTGIRIREDLILLAPASQGWVGKSLARESQGYHLSTCTLMYQTMENPEFLDQVNYIADQLIWKEQLSKTVLDRIRPGDFQEICNALSGKNTYLRTYNKVRYGKEAKKRGQVTIYNHMQFRRNQLHCIELLGKIRN